MKNYVKFSLLVGLFGITIGSFSSAFLAKEAKQAKADAVSLHTNFKLDWDGQTGISADGNGYKNFTASGNDVVLANRSAGTPINMYDDVYNTFANPSPKYQITPYSGYKSVQIRNYNNGGTTYYMYLNYGNKYDGTTERDYGNFIEFTPMGAKTTVIKTLKITTRDNTSKENLWYKTSDDGVNWTGDLTNTYKLPFNASTKTYDLSMAIGSKYLRVHQCNNANQDLRTSVTISSIDISYEEEGSIKVEFDSQNGSAETSQYVNNGDHLIQPSDPEKAPINGHRYEFLGWFTESDGGVQWDFANGTVSEAMTLYAHWDDIPVNSYTVNYVSNGDAAVSSETVGLGETFTVPSNPIKTSDDPRYVYSFDAWCIDEQLTHTYDFEVLPIEDITLYGRFTKSIAGAPEGTVSYNVKNHKITDDGYAQESEVLSFEEFHSRVVDSRQTFDYGSTSHPQIYLDVQGVGEGYGIKKGKKDGKGTSEYDVVVYNSTVNLTWADKTKVLTFVRFQFHRINYQSYDSFNINLRLTGSESILSSCLAPGGKNTVDEDCVQATFTADQDVRGVSIDVLDSHIYVDLRYIVLGFADEVVETAAIKFATAFNDNNVCGTTPTDGLDSNKWEAQATKYDQLSDAVKNYLATYDGENAEIIEMLQRYDRVIYLHGEDYDFMGRIALANIPVSHMATFNTVNAADSYIIVLIISMVLASSCLAVFLIRRKKQR